MAAAASNAAPASTGASPARLESRRESRRTRRDYGIFIPAVTALSLGLLYGLGALFKTAELRAAHLHARDTLTLVPIQQLLARGIAALSDNFYALAVFMVFAGVVAAGHFATDAAFGSLRARTAKARQHHTENKTHLARVDAEIDKLNKGFQELRETTTLTDEERKARAAELAQQEAAIAAEMKTLQAEVAENGKEIDALEADMPSGWRRFSSAALVLAAAASSLFTPPFIAAGLVIANGMFVISPRLLRAPARTSVAVGAFLIGLTLNGFANPHPLPVAHVATTAGTVSGPLIAATGDTWYIAGGGRDAFRAIPSSTVTSVTITPVPAPSARSVLDWIRRI